MNTDTDAVQMPPMPSNVSHVMRRIRRCESETAAQLVLEHFAMEYARALLASKPAENSDELKVCLGCNSNWPLHDLDCPVAVEALSAPTAPAQSCGAFDFPALVSRFLAWPLPQTVASDGCVTNNSYAFPRSGTNLLNADEAEAMLRHVLAVTQRDAIKLTPEESERFEAALKSAPSPNESLRKAMSAFRAHAKEIK